VVVFFNLNYHLNGSKYAVVDLRLRRQQGVCKRSRQVGIVFLKGMRGIVEDEIN